MNIQKATELINDFIDVWGLEQADDVIVMNIFKKDIEAFKTAIKALEKQAFFENEVGEIREWFVDNKDMMLDSAMEVAGEGFNVLTGKYKLIDKVDLDAIVEDVVNEIQKGILNVLDSYRGD